MNELVVTCKIIEDLMPLYADGICSEDTKTVVEHHTAECPDCKKKLDDMTAELTKPAEPQKELEHSKLFKALHKRYAKLSAITLILCLLIMIPGAVCCVLTLNEYSYSGTSWSTLRAERQIKRMAAYMADCSSEEAAEIMGLDGIVGQMFADDYNAYFAKYPVSKYDVNVQYTEFASGDNAHNFDIEGEIVFYTTGNYFTVINAEFGVRRNGAIEYTGTGNREWKISPVLEPDENSSLIGGYNTYTGYPRYTDEVVSAADSFYSFMREKMYKYAVLRIENMDIMDVYSDYLDGDDASKWSEYKEKADELYGWDDYTDQQTAYEDMCVGFGFYDIEQDGDIRYEKTENDKYYKGYFVRDFVMRFNKDGNDFSVSFTARLSEGGLINPVENIAYSENTPDEFKKQFEVFFA